MRAVPLIWAWVALALVVGTTGAVWAQLGVSGSFEVEGTVRLNQPLRLDLLGTLDLSIKLHDLSVDGHAHLGDTGLEDIIMRWSISLGELTLRNATFFAQPSGQLTLTDGSEMDSCYPLAVAEAGCSMLLVRQELLVRSSGSGLSIDGLALVEDVAFPDAEARKPSGATYGLADQRFGLGGSVTVTLRPADGLTVVLAAGVCVEQQQRRLQHHRAQPRVSAACSPGSGFKSPHLPVFEELAIRKLTLTPGLWADAEIHCAAIVCEFVSQLTLSPALVFSTARLELRWRDLTEPGGLEGATLEGGGGPLSLRLRLDGVLGFRELAMALERPLGPLDAEIRLLTRATGFSELVLNLTKSQNGTQLVSELTLRGTGVLAFRSWELGVSTAIGVWRLSTEARLSPAGLDELSARVRVSF